MKHSFGKTIVIKLGGSILFPDPLDTDRIHSWVSFCADLVAQGHRLILVIGGGAAARTYQDAAGAIATLSEPDLDRIGIAATYMNAVFFRLLCGDLADPAIISRPEVIAEPTHPITIASGWEPGNSTDYIAFRIAEALHIPEVVVVSKPDYIYSCDPSKGNARPLETLSWKEYRAMIPDKWKPGIHVPIDPTAARFADEHHLAVFMIGGASIDTIRALLAGEDCIGTTLT